MKYLQKTILAGIITLFGGTAFAGGNSQWASIVQVAVSNDILVKTDESVMFDPDSCNGGNPPVFYAIPQATARKTGYWQQYSRPRRIQTNKSGSGLPAASVRGPRPLA